MPVSHVLFAEKPAIRVGRNTAAVRAFLSIPNTIHFRQYNGFSLRNYNSMLVLRHKATFISNHCPTVIQGFSIS